MSQQDPQKSRAPVAQRLRQLREALGHSQQTGFCAHYGFDYKTWSNYERGFPLPTNVAIRLAGIVPGLTLDWLYRGRYEGMPFELAAKLGALSSDETTKRTG